MSYERIREGWEWVAPLVNPTFTTISRPNSCIAPSALASSMRTVFGFQDSSSRNVETWWLFSSETLRSPDSAGNFPRIPSPA